MRSATEPLMPAFSSAPAPASTTAAGEVSPARPRGARRGRSRPVDRGERDGLPRDAVLDARLDAAREVGGAGAGESVEKLRERGEQAERVLPDNPRVRA